MEILSVKEHEKLPVVQKREVGVHALSVTQANALGRMEQHLPAGTFRWGHHSVKFAQYCGVIALGGLTLEVLPKIHGKEEDPGACRQALIRMLYRAKRLKPARGVGASISLQKHSLLDIFVLHFCNQLHAELMQGMIRRYIEKNENLGVIKGRLRIGQQVKFNVAHKERLFCQFDELSADNPHNQILKYVLRMILRLPLGVNARKQVAELHMRFEAISDFHPNVSDLDKLSFDRSTNRYKAIFQQCRWFLLGLHPDVLAGKHTSFSLLFDMNKLFEAYVASELRKYAWRYGLRLREQGPQKYFVRRDDIDKPAFLLKPDMVLLDEAGGYFMIGDAKWKLLDDKERKLGVTQADLYQIASYALRYGVDQVALFYPRQKRLQEEIQMTIQGSHVTLHVIPVDIVNGLQLVGSLSSIFQLNIEKSA
ncbi:McrC family protein [Desulfosediminicola flagellatus]|uniref:McrC family protein n=1 Tax=Desulfosediminicola flagellatus TaxID=2569541 RepID=UPI0010AC4DE0|nr:restriction endonuclease [Desulfosediminicola flagellatus]